MDQDPNQRPPGEPGSIPTPDVPGIPPPPPQQGSSTRRWVFIGLGGCLVLILLLLLVVGGCAAFIVGSGGGKDSKSGSAKGEQSSVAIGQPVTVGDVTWTVTNARQADQLRQEGAPKGAGKTEQGNFVVVDFDFTNNGSDPVTLDSASLGLIDSTGRESNPNPDQVFYVPRDRQIFLENINPGVTRQGQAIFEVAPGASGFQLQAGDTNPFIDENGYVDLGF